MSKRFQTSFYLQYVFDITPEEDRIAMCLEQTDTSHGQTIKYQKIGLYIMKASHGNCNVDEVIIFMTYFNHTTAYKLS